MDWLCPFDQAASFLPFDMRQVALSVSNQNKERAEEFRLRVGRQMSITMPEGEMAVSGCKMITSNDLRSVLEIATQASAHTALEHVRNGFVTVRGGHRLGICGTAVLKDGAIHNLRCISSLNIRIAKQIPGLGNDLVHRIRRQSKLPSVLVLAPPGAGKTTILRDLIRGLSSGVGGRPLRVGVVDERGELAAFWDGVPQLDVGQHTDVMDGCGKAEGLMMLLRGMNPQVLAVDEITAPNDVEAMGTASGCGVSLLATAHGRSVDDLRRRPLYAELIQKQIFQKILRIEMVDGKRRYHLEDMVC